MTRFLEKVCPGCGEPFESPSRGWKFSPSILVEVEPGVFVELAVCVSCFGKLGERAARRFKWTSS